MNGLWVRYFHLFCCVTLCRGSCPQKKNSGDLSFTKNLTSYIPVRTGQFADIECCAEGYDIISWWFLKLKESRWRAYPFYNFSCSGCDIGLRLENHNQTLVVTQAGSEYNGSFLCSVQNLTTGTSIKHHVQLDVYDCTDRGRPLPLPPNDVYADLGQNASFSCGGDFGCKDRGLRSVDWVINDTPVDLINCTRYKQETILSSKGTVVKTSLTIMDVQPKDFHLNFTCWVFSDHPPSSSFTVHLFRISKPPSPVVMPSETKIIISTGTAVFFLVVLILTLYTKCGPQISLYCKSRISCFTFIEKGNKRYHAFICHSDENQAELEVVELIKGELTSRKYDVACMTEDFILGGQYRLQAAGQLVQKSAAVIFLGGEITVEQEQMIQTVKSSMQPNRITVVLLPKSGKKQYSKHEDFKGLYSLKWPGVKSNRIRNQFYCSLQLRLPRVRQLNVNVSESRNERETQRLLSTPSTTSTTTSERRFDFDSFSESERYGESALDRVPKEAVTGIGTGDQVDNDEIEERSRDNHGSATFIPRQRSEESGYDSHSPCFSSC